MLKWLRAFLCNFRKKPLTPPLGYRKLNPHVRLDEGIKRARKRSYAVRKESCQQRPR